MFRRVGGICPPKMCLLLQFKLVFENGQNRWKLLIYMHFVNSRGVDFWSPQKNEKYFFDDPGRDQFRFFVFVWDMLQWQCFAVSEVFARPKCACFCSFKLVFENGQNRWKLLIYKHLVNSHGVDFWSPKKNEKYFFDVPGRDQFRFFVFVWDVLQ